ncbi:hypothetical protein GEU84_002510 [Fertoebacter nigrum]|uniref:Uncharacterized protein n=1 Tax=Fertoeibacter niger TaxID=2656921 RepID=A0A8X8GUB3_9RHOB|nr:hypothetical protein [Fertoeibacter niger]NUB43242.1 hypothetical protein [Fertoeibacter niger]
MRGLALALLTAVAMQPAAAGLLGGPLPPTVTLTLEQLGDAGAVLARQSLLLDGVMLRLTEDEATAAPRRISHEEQALIAGALAALGGMTSAKALNPARAPFTLVSWHIAYSRREISGHALYGTADLPDSLTTLAKALFGPD